MPATRSSRLNRTIEISSDNDDGPHVNTPPRLRKKRPVERPSGNKAGVKRPNRSDSIFGAASTSRVSEYSDSELSQSGPPSASTRAKLLSGSTGRSLSFEEKCLAEVEGLRVKYGEDDDGYGVKVSQRAPITSVTVTVSLLLDPKIRAFTLMLVNNPAHPEMFKGLKFFPPVRVQLDISKSSTKLILSASWLLKIHLKMLTKRMDEVFRQQAGSHPFQTALTWLEQNGVKTAEIMYGRSVSYVTPTVDVAKRQPAQIQFQGLEPIRHVFLTTQYRRVNIAKTPALREVASFDCAICFEHKSVMMASVFPTCSHFFCVNCVRQDFALKVKETRIHEICCLAEGCHVQAPTEMVKFLLDRETFQRYCDLSADTFVEGASFVRCPQKNCNAPMELAPDARREVKCPTCRYEFCSTCKSKPHPKTPCLTDGQKNDIREKYTKANAREKKVLEERYGVNNIKFVMEDAESVDWIAKNAKPCPKCKTPIQKNDGCNKMICTAHGCGCYFCWLCGEALKAPNPYLHFQSGPCSGRLHEGNNNVHAPPNFNLPNLNVIEINAMMAGLADDMWMDGDFDDEDGIEFPPLYHDGYDSDSDDEGDWHFHPFDQGEWDDGDDDSDDAEDEDAENENGDAGAHWNFVPPVDFPGVGFDDEEIMFVADEIELIDVSDDEYF